MGLGDMRARGLEVVSGKQRALSVRAEAGNISGTPPRRPTASLPNYHGNLLHLG
jgi:hypothetical protein